MRVVAAILLLSFSAFASDAEPDADVAAEEDSSWFWRNRGPVLMEVIAFTLSCFSTFLGGYGVDLESRTTRTPVFSRTPGMTLSNVDGRPYEIAGASLGIVSLAVAFAGIIWMAQVNASP